MAFHPDNPKRLASSGTDGIVNVFDLTQTSEDDALETSTNTETSIQKVIWYKNKGSEEINSLACITHTEEAKLWNVEDYEPNTTFSRLDVCAGMKRNVTELSYIVDIYENQDGGGGLQILAGSSCSARPCLRLLQVKKTKLRPLSDFSSSRSIARPALTRCSILDESLGILYSGGEDGVLCKWKRK